MSKGQPTSGPRPTRPLVAVDELPWQDVGGGSGAVGDGTCGTARSLDIELAVMISGPATCVLVPIDGSIRVISAGAVLGTLRVDLSDELVACMQDGWRYTGLLTPVASDIAHLVIEGRHIE